MQTQAKLLLALFASLLFSGANVFAAANTDRVATLAYASTNVTTSAYVQVVSSSAVSSGSIQVCDTSGQVLKIATGQASSEVDRFTVEKDGCTLVGIYTTPGTRFSIKAISATANSGFFTMSFLP